MTHIHANIVKKYLDDNKRDRLRSFLKDAEIPDIAVLIDQLPDRYKLRVYLALPTNVSSEVLLEVSTHSRKFILKSLKDKYIVSLIEGATSDDSADILGEVPEHKAKDIFLGLSKKKKEAIAQLMQHEEDTAGHLMQSELIDLPVTVSVKEAIDRVKKKTFEMEGVNYVYVTDKEDRLKGVISVADLIAAKSNKKLGQVMKKDVIKLTPEMDVEEVASMFRKEDVMALPVVDTLGKLLGRVTVDDVLGVMEDEATEDMFRIAGVHPDEHVFDPIRKSFKRRVPWLILNLMTAILAAFIVAFYEDTIKAFILLAAFMPIIAGMGGNAGTQTLTLIVRGLALNQINKHNFKKILIKEMSLGLFNGLITGILMAIIAYIWLNNLALGIVIVAAMTINLVVAGLIGSSIPMLLKTFKIDPAVASSVFITTFTDVVGFFSFLGIASLLLKWIAPI